MKKFWMAIWTFLKKPWVAWTLFFIALIVGIWLLSWVFEFIKNYRLYIILFLVVLWGLNNIRLQQKKNLDENGESEPEYTPEERALVEEEIQSGFLAAIKTLSRRRWYLFDFLFKRTEGDIPWFITLGMPGSGKTESLLNSDLNFPLELNDPKQSETYLSWRYSSAAAFLDLRGTTVAHNRETDNLKRAAWQDTLNLIEEYRYRKSFTGVVLSVSLEDLLNQSEEVLAVQAYHLSKALQDLEAAMGFQCPIYLQITKTDLLNGFKEFADLLNIEDQQQGIGFSLPNDVYPLRHFSKKFNVLIDALFRKILLNLHHEKNPQKAATAALFPSELQELKQRLERYLALVFESNQYRERSFLRGLFFVSAIFSPRVQQNLLQPYINEFGLRLRAPNYLINTRPSQLARSFYTRFVLAERNVYRFSYLTRQGFILRNGFIALVSLGLLSIFIYYYFESYDQNRSRVHALYQAAQKYAANLQQGGQSNLDQRNAQLRLLDEMDHVFQPKSDPRSMHWGLYQGQTMVAALDKFYLPVLQEQFLPIMLDNIQAVIHDPKSSSGDVYDFLRAYIMLGDHSHLDVNFISRLMDNQWDSLYASQPELHKLLTASMQSYFRHKTPPIKLEPDLIKYARDRLKDITPSEQIYSQLNSLSYGTNYSIVNSSLRDFNQIFVENEGITTIPPLFTLKGYTQDYEKKLNQLIESINDNDWVLDQKTKQVISPEQAQVIKQRVQTMYFNQYISLWKQSLYSLKIKSFTSLGAAHDVLTVLAQNDSPLESILRSVNENTALVPGDKTPPPNATKSMFDIKKASTTASRGTAGVKSMATTANVLKNSSAIVSAVKSSLTSKVRTPVGEAFYDLNRLTLGNDGGDVPFDQIQDAFIALNDYMNDIAGSADPVKAAYLAAAAHAIAAGGGAPAGGAPAGGKGAKEDPLTTLVKLANDSPEPVKRWLLDIVQNTWNIILQNSVVYLNEEWAITVYPQYETLYSGYPFNKNSLVDVDPLHLSEFIKKDGILSKFITTFLGPFINMNAAPWQLNTIDGATLPIGSLQKLYMMMQLQPAFFGGGKAGEDKQISIPFTITTIQLDNSLFMAQLKLGDKVSSSLHGPQIPEAMVWISDPNGSASLQFTATNRAVTNTGKHGVWAWLKLLDTAELSTRDNLTVSAKFTLYDKNVTYLLKTNGVVNPFNLPKLRAITLPENL
jgi:type VI secretion system protein ImpL